MGLGQFKVVLIDMFSYLGYLRTKSGRGRTLIHEVLFSVMMFDRKPQCYNVESVESPIIRQQDSIKGREMLTTNQI